MKFDASPLLAVYLTVVIPVFIEERALGGY